MKLGQTSVVVFLSKFVGSALGFVATLYFARELGAEVIGIYALVMTVVGWLILVAELGIGEALIKRISEGEQKGAYLTAAIVWVLSLAAVISIATIFGQPLLESYISAFDQYVAISVIWFIVAIIFIKLFYGTVFRLLKGERKVHIAGLLNPIQVGGQSLIQIGLVFLGYGLLGMLVGSILGGILVGLLGLVWVTTRPSRPRKHHFRSLFDYAKFSWLGKFKHRAFNEIDILLLGVFVPTALVGVYSVVWSLSKFVQLFGSAIKSAMFPEISYTSSQDSDQAAAGMVEDSLAYTGLIAIPGLVGGVILSDRLLQLYGEEFVEGTTVLGLLILAVLIFSYQKQLMGGLNGLDRPDLAFRVNAVFIALNASLNLVLIWQYGIEGAAVASVFSTAVSFVLAYYMLSQMISFDFPYAQIARQWTAALAMGAIVFGGRQIIETTGLIGHNAIIVAVLVGLGAGVYFLILFAISTEFRKTVGRNLPKSIRFINE